MKTGRKALLLVLCAVMLVSATAAATFAYLTDDEAVVNTFTVGQVGIKLDEAPVDANGQKIAGDRVTTNVYHLIPGHTYDKDPTIHVDEDSEDCYLFVKVDNGIADIEGGETIAVQMERLGWKKVTGIDGVANLYVFAKDIKKLDKYAISKGGDVVVFESFTIAGDGVDNAKIKTFADAEVKVTAYAVQAAGFEDTAPAEIWAATFGANTNS